MTVVTKLQEINRPLCQHKVHVGGGQTITRRRREDQTKRLGIPLDQCGARGDFRLDGAVLCRMHAGHVALEILLENGDG